MSLTHTQHTYMHAHAPQRTLSHTYRPHAHTCTHMHLPLRVGPGARAQLQESSQGHPRPHQGLASARGRGDSGARGRAPLRERAACFLAGDLEDREAAGRFRGAWGEGRGKTRWHQGQPSGVLGEHLGEPSLNVVASGRRRGLQTNWPPERWPKGCWVGQGSAWRARGQVGRGGQGG